MSWLSRMTVFLSPLLTRSVISAYIGLITYTIYRDHATWARYFVGLPLHLVLTVITAVVLRVIFGESGSPFFPSGAAQFPLPAAISFWTFVMATPVGISPANNTVRALGYLSVLGISVLLGGHIFGDAAADEVEAVSTGIICWTVLAAIGLYLHRNWRAPRLGLPIAFLTLVVAASVIGYEGNMDTLEHVPAIIGLVLAAVAVVLAFTFGNATPLQRQIILTLAALAGGAIATEIPGFLNIDLSLGQKTGVAAGGALAVFVILYFWSASVPRE
jgi:hypothetical protein